MTRYYPYIIVGGGMTADAAVKGIRDLDAEGEIALFSEESHPPYKRPPLSKDLWFGKKESEIWCSSPDHEGVTLYFAHSICGLDPEKNLVTDVKGNEFSYGKLLLATGGRPATLDVFDDRVIYFRTLEDCRAIQSLLPGIDSIAVVGGGFIGSEMAAALVDRGASVTLLFPEKGVGAKIFPEGLSLRLNQLYRDKGVDVVPGVKVTSVTPEGETVSLTLTKENEESEHTHTVDLVVVGIGLVPNTELAERGGLPVRDGIIADACLKAGHPAIFTAGDASRFPCEGLNGLIHVEHEDHAVTGGRHAGRAMTGEERPYNHLPFFYSDLFHVGYEAVGECDPSLNVVEDWISEYEKGVIYYMNDGHLTGVLLLDVWNKVDEARERICSTEETDAKNLIGSIRPDKE